MTGKIQTWLCRAVDPTFVGSPEPLAHGRNIVSLSLFCKYNFGESSSELAELVSFLYSCGRCTRCFNNKLCSFSVIIVKCVFANSFFPCTLRLWHSLPVECSPLTYDINGLNTYILTIRGVVSNSPFMFFPKVIMFSLHNNKCAKTCERQLTLLKAVSKPASILKKSDVLWRHYFIL